MKTKIIICNKKKRGTLILFAFVASLFNTTIFAQDIHFSQFDETLLQLNPADAGVPHDIRVVTNYKNQWQSVGSPYKTFALSADARLLKDKKHHLGLGLDFFSDKSGNANLTSNQDNLSLSGIITVNEHSILSAGLMSGFAQRSISLGGLEWGSQYDGSAYNSTLPTGETGTAQAFNFVDLGAGMEYSYGNSEMYISANNARKVNIGVAVFHPNNPTYTFYGDNTQVLHTKWVFHGDAAIGIKNTNLVLKPSYIVFIQGATKEITPGLSFQYILQEASKYTGNKKPMAISIGGYERVQDAFIAAFKFEYSNYAIGLSYDMNLSKLKTVTKTRGGFEISLRFIAPGAFGKSATSKSKFI
ncbi:MAG: PorP/SprF family type IX secretion system membrane protein [Bacteroidetes bacterium]|nr:PorP/SprF family type IX secretion system membrane protein [Bacteroidota bacterium]